jgi:hypothetical protein
MTEFDPSATSAVSAEPTPQQSGSSDMVDNIGRKVRRYSRLDPVAPVEPAAYKPYRSVEQKRPSEHEKRYLA